MIRHIVLMKCTQNAKQADINAMFEALGALRQSIPGILTFEGGENNSPEGIDRDYTHAFTMDFVDRNARDAYLPHPDHIQAQKVMRKVLADVTDNILVLDFSIQTED